MLITKKMIDDFWNSLTPQEKEKARIEQEKIIQEDRELEEQFRKEHLERSKPKEVKLLSIAKRICSKL